MELQDATLGDIAERLHELLSSDRNQASGDELLRSAHDWEAAGRATDAARIWVAPEMENESRRELDTAGLAYRHGFPTAKKLIAMTTNVSERTAGSRMALGRQLRSALSITGLPVPSNFPAVESALHAGQIGVDAATIICRTLTEVVPRTTWSKAVDEAERHLVHAATETIGDTGADQARRYTVDELGRLATRIREHLDPDGAEPRDAVKHALRGFSYPKVGADGMARGKYALPPLQLGVFLTAVDSILSPRTPDPEGPPPASDESDPDERGYVPPDLRTSEQKLGRGVGWIDGSNEPVPMSTVNMLQCDADTIVTLFAHNGQVLNQGKTQRLATRTQSRALIRGKPHVRPPEWHDPKRTPIPAGQQRAGRPYFR